MGGGGEDEPPFRRKRLKGYFIVLRFFFMLEKYPFNQESPRQSKPKKGQFMNFSQGHSGTKVRDVNRACFPKEKHQNSQEWGKFMNFSFGPFFGLVCRGDS